MTKCLRVPAPLLCLLLLPGILAAQTLARPGWAGSGLTIAPWWQNAVLYQLDPHGFGDSDDSGTGDLRGCVRHLDYLQSLGVDVISLVDFEPKTAPGSNPLSRFESVDPALGTLDDLDDVIREASRDNMRVVIDLDPQQLPDPAALVSVARFWLNRGVAGISLTSTDPSHSTMDPANLAAQVRQLHEVMHSIPGPQRILIAEAASDAAKTALRGAGADLVLDPSIALVSHFDAASLRTALAKTLDTVPGTTPVIATDAAGLPRSAGRLGDGTHNDAIAKVLATVLLATRADPRLYFGQEIGLSTTPGSPAHMQWGTPHEATAKSAPQLGPKGAEVAAEDADPGSVLAWYRRLIEIHHGNAAFRTGRILTVNEDARQALVWISKREPVSLAQPPVVVLCNLTAQPMTLSLTADMKALHLRGNFLRTILRSDNGMGGMDLGAVKLAPFGIYIGELRY